MSITPSADETRNGIVIYDQHGKIAINLVSSGPAKVVKVFGQFGREAISLISNEMNNQVQVYDRDGNLQWASPLLEDLE